MGNQCDVSIISPALNFVIVPVARLIAPQAMTVAQVYTVMVLFYGYNKYILGGSSHES